MNRFVIRLFATSNGKHIEQNIYGFATKQEAWAEFDHHRNTMSRSIGERVDGSVYEATAEEIKRLKL